MLAAVWRQKWRIAIVVLLTAAGLYYWYFIREPDWHASAIEDVNFIQETLQNDHPGWEDETNPGFRERLSTAYASAMAMAQKVESPAGYYYTVRHLPMAFEDAHLAAQFYRDIPRERRWPGFAVGLQDGEVAVIAREDDDAPAVGSVLSDCDGNSPQQLYEERVLPQNFLSWLPSFEGGDWPWILIDSGNPFATLPSTCTFVVGGAEQQFALDWRPFDDQLRAEILDPFEPKIDAETSLRFFDEGIVWISIASFFDSGEEVSAELSALIADITENRERIENAQTLVVDVRGNLGGASKAGYEVAAALWGADFVGDRTPNFARADWRASEANLERLDDAMLPLQIQFGSDSELYQTVEEIRDGMAAAVQSGEPYFAQENPVTEPSGSAALRLPPQIYFLTDQNCVSACLDFADLMKSIKGVVHIGGETAGDSLYLEVVTVDLPSGIGQLVYPTAIHRGRERTVNQTYTPSIPFTGDMSDRDELLEWVRSLEWPESHPFQD